MSLSPPQVRKLKAKLRTQHVRQREVNGQQFSYLEGWHVVAEANRIFGFDGWDRETVESKCLWAKQSGDRFSAAYLTRVRITVQAGDRRVTREGTGFGEATSASPGSAHEIAAKAAETDGTKRAFVTFGNPFGLSLYSTPAVHPDAPQAENVERHASEGLRTNGSAPPIRLDPSPDTPAPEPLLPQGQDAPPLVAGKIDKSQLTISEPKRERNPSHLRFVASRPCLICGRNRAHAHHVTFAQPRALGRKSSDEHVVPLCPAHHRELHQSGDEKKWWEQRAIDPLMIAQMLWEAH